MNSDAIQDFDQWAIVEVMGHRVLAGHVTAANVAGAGMLKVDVPATSTTPAFTQYVGPGSVFAITPATEEFVRKHAEQQYRWSKPQHVALPAPADAEPIEVDAPISEDIDEANLDSAMEELTEKCARCDGCGKIANSDDGEPWTMWLKLPLESSQAVLAGIIRPIDCPVCKGSGFKVNAELDPHRDADVIAELNDEAEEEAA